jgi:hypothetical protein
MSERVGKSKTYTNVLERVQGSINVRHKLGSLIPSGVREQACNVPQGDIVAKHNWKIPHNLRRSFGWLASSDFWPPPLPPIPSIPIHNDKQQKRCDDRSNIDTFNKLTRLNLHYQFSNEYDRISEPANLCDGLTGSNLKHGARPCVRLHNHIII